jgi:hypothetical protein
VTHRIGGGPGTNSGGDLIAPHLAALHGSQSKLAKDTAVTEVSDEVSPETHEILTGSRVDGTAFPGNAQRTCNNWTSIGAGSAQVGYSDRTGPGNAPHTLPAAAVKTFFANPAGPACSTASQSIRRTVVQGMLDTYMAIAEMFRTLLAVPISTIGVL